jgi:alkyl hydroperoxide reductase subunit AhpC
MIGLEMPFFKTLYLDLSQALTFFAIIKNRIYRPARNCKISPKLMVEIMSMSIDSVFVHKMWDDKELSKMVDGGVPFAMLSDTGGKAGKTYGVFD